MSIVCGAVFAFLMQQCENDQSFSNQFAYFLLVLIFYLLVFGQTTQK